MTPRTPLCCSRRPSCEATHSSTPTRGAVTCSGATCAWRRSSLSMSDLLHDCASQQAARPQQDRSDQDGKDVEVLERGALRQVARRVRLAETDDETAEHRAGDAPDPTDHSRGEALQSCDEAHVVVDLPENEPEDHTGRAGQRRADEEREGDHMVDVDAHHLRRLTIV